MIDKINSGGQIFLHLGNWQALLYADALNAKSPLICFSDYFHAFISHVGNLDDIVGCFFITSPLGLEQPDHLTWWPVCRRGIWEKFSKILGISYHQFYRSPFSKLNGTMQHPEPFQIFWSELDSIDSGNSLFSSNNQKNHQMIAQVIDKPDEFSYTHIFVGTLVLAIQWHIERGGICLHSSAVARKNNGFLFLGASEAGKSTIAQLSTTIGYPALGDDLNFIINDGNESYYLVAAPSPIISQVEYSPLRPPLMGIFILVQDKQDSLTPLRSMQVARALYKEFFQETPYVAKLSDKLIRFGFQICCDIARKTPGYKLHFRKSPDFWKLIDEQFPD